MGSVLALENSKDAAERWSAGGPINLLAAFIVRGDIRMLVPDRPLFSRPSATPKAPAGSPSPDQIVALRQFVARVGGIENARQALALLATLKRAA